MEVVDCMKLKVRRVKLRVLKFGGVFSKCMGSSGVSYEVFSKYFQMKCFKLENVLCKIKQM
jgi:hypothetical protein